MQPIASLQDYSTVRDISVESIYMEHCIITLTKVQI